MAHAKASNLGLMDQKAKLHESRAPRFPLCRKGTKELTIKRLHKPNQTNKMPTISNSIIADCEDSTLIGAYAGVPENLHVQIS